MFVLEAHCLEGRAVHTAAVSRYEVAGEEGNRVGCQLKLLTPTLEASARFVSGSLNSGHDVSE